MTSEQALRHAGQLIEAGKFSDAEQALGGATVADPLDPYRTFLRGVVCHNTDRPAAAIELLEHADRMRPGSDLILTELGVAYRKAGRPDEAAEKFKAAICVNRANTFAHFNLGRVCGEALSFHRSQDIKMALEGRITLCPPKDIVYSCYGEQGVLDDLLARLPSIPRYCVDVGASDGVTFSNSYPLFRAGWPGVAIEARRGAVADLAYALKDFSQPIKIVCDFVGPDNIESLLATLGVPHDFGFLTLDIDSYDYDVADSTLRTYRPAIVCMEINERVPPPVKFAVHYVAGYPYPDLGILGGTSITMACDLLEKHSYGPVWLEYNNLFAVREDLLGAVAPQFTVKAARPLWEEGYLRRTDRHLKAPWNDKYEPLITMAPGIALESYRQAVRFLDSRAYTLCL